jgi:hypothetical protein
MNYSAEPEAPLRHHYRFLVVAVMLFGSYSNVRGAPTQWPASAGGNGHYYDYIVAGDITRANANAAAQALVLGGVHGYLATITSANENAFVAAHFNGEAGPIQSAWLGGYQDTSAPDYSEPAGGWRWVTGEPWVYTNWYTGGPVFPDDFGGAQNYLRWLLNFQWDDIENDPTNPSVQTMSGYFVEYAVPEPASLGVLGLGAMALLVKRPRT